MALTKPIAEVAGLVSAIGLFGFMLLLLPPLLSGALLKHVLLGSPIRPRHGR